MAIERKQIGPTETYREHTITVHYMGPDLIVRVDGKDMPAFYVDAEAARAGGRRHIDEIHKAANTRT